MHRDLGLFVVADGMGGHAAGEVASRLAVSTLVEELAASPLEDRTPATALATLRAAVLAANRAILERAARDPRCAGMGTTLTALLTTGDGSSLCLAHVGDSRAYRLSGDALEQLTTDQTWVQEQVALGRLTPEEARYHPAAAVLTMALGTTTEPDIQTWTGSARAGDVFLLCSDGLTGPVEDAVLQATLAKPAPVEELAAELVAAANGAGGPDNISVIVLRAIA